VAVIAGRHDGDDPAIAHHGFVVKQHRFGIGELKLDHATFQPCFAFPQYRVTPDEIGFLGADGKSESSLQHVILIGDVMAEMPERLFDAATVERVEPAKFQAVIRARPGERFKDVGGLICRNIKLPSQFADIGDAMGASQTHADLDLAGGCEREAIGAQIIGAYIL
jgi:hypothetical protein